MTMAKHAKLRKSLYAALGLCSSVIIISALVGVSEDIKGMSCSGIAGARISCLEEYAFYRVGIIAIPVIALLISVLFIDSLKIDAGKTEVKSENRR